MLSALLWCVTAAVATAAPQSNTRGSGLEVQSGYRPDLRWSISAKAGASWLLENMDNPWSVGPTLGFSFGRLFSGDKQLALVDERTTHILEEPGLAFEKGTGMNLTKDVARGHTRQHWLHLSFMWSPPVGRVERMTFSPTVEAGVGVLLTEGWLELAGAEGRTLLTSHQTLPGTELGLGVLCMLTPTLGVRTGVNAIAILSFDRAELGGGDHLRFALRVTPLLEVLGRF
jgi:hypothetical protein